ncbi:MAG: DNA recombination protein RmuC [Candidatus Binataceae bacterium]|nr:DNA recombination protein RmuC [Candidatus Binataceae bacterium]
MIVVLIAANIILTIVLIALHMAQRARIGAAIGGTLEPLLARIDALRGSLEDKFSVATADMAHRLAETNGALRQDLSDRLEAAFRQMRDAVDAQMQTGRVEQSRALDQTVVRLEGKFSELQRATEQRLEGFADRQSQALALNRKELSDALALNATAMREDLATLSKRIGDGMDAIRAQVDQKLLAIGSQVAEKLDQNIKEGFKQFEKVQEHLRAAEEQLRNVGTIGVSINELNNLLKLPHLRGRFGEASLERLLEDFLPAEMYEMQSGAGQNGLGRADAIIKFPDRVLPIDAKFPREQVLPLFESSDPATLAAARVELGRALKEQGKRIAGYIHPENGTTDMALMYLPSETLYMETVLNGDLSEWLNQQKVFPVSPNTLIVTLQSIQMVFKMYAFAKGFEKATEELRRAQKSFAYFEDNFEKIGKSLEKAQDAFGTARRQLSTYSRRVVDLTGAPVPEIEPPAGDG